MKTLIFALALGVSLPAQLADFNVDIPPHVTVTSIVHQGVPAVCMTWVPQTQADTFIVFKPPAAGGIRLNLAAWAFVQEPMPAGFYTSILMVAGRRINAITTIPYGTQLPFFSECLTIVRQWWTGPTVPSGIEPWPRTSLEYAGYCTYGEHVPVAIGYGLLGHWLNPNPPFPEPAIAIGTPPGGVGPPLTAGPFTKPLMVALVFTVEML